jgi:hypothetical protein
MRMLHNLSLPHGRLVEAYSWQDEHVLLSHKLPLGDGIDVDGIGSTMRRRNWMSESTLFFRVR